MRTQTVYKQVDIVVKRYPILAHIRQAIEEAYALLETTYAQGHRVLIGGNGGSCADGDHIVAELMKSFVLPRTIPKAFAQQLQQVDAHIGCELAKKLQGSLPALSLSHPASLSSAYANDVDATMAMAQQVHGYGKQGDVFLGITTSGNSKNIVYAAVVAKAKGMRVMGLTGKDGGVFHAHCDVSICVPEIDTHRVQELHLPIYHCLCLMLEERFFQVETTT